MMAEKPGYDGSTALKSVMQENVVDSIIAGMFQTDAYLKHYPTCKSREVARVNCSRLLTNANVEARLVYKRALIAQNCEITEVGQIRRFQELSRLAVELNQISSAISAEDKITTICGLYEKDNKQKTGKTVVEILALVANSRRLEASVVDSKGLTDGQGTIDAPIAAEFESKEGKPCVH